jgi:phospholipase/carboxylesterase
MKDRDKPGWGGLDVVSRGPMREDEPGGMAVVLLHGWGAPADDLVPLGDELAHPRTRFFFPGGPLPERGGGRAWWHFDDPSDRPGHAWEDNPKPGHAAHPQLLAVRAALQEVLRTIKGRYQPERLMVAGFSQGAMVALDLALAASAAQATTEGQSPAPGVVPIDRVAALSGILLEDSLPFLHVPGAASLPVLIAHGRHDPVVPFEGGERMKAILERHGHAITWCPFNGGHEIPRATLEELRTFLFGRT